MRQKATRYQPNQIPDLNEPVVCEVFYQTYNMNHLPNELLTEIYSYLPAEDIANLPFHMTSRAFLDKEHKRCFNESYASLEKNDLLRLVRISTNPSLADLVTKVTFSTKRPGFIGEERFLKKAWKEHVRRRNKSLCSAAVKDWASHGHERDPAPNRETTSKLPENLTLENFHELIGVAESECYYCHDKSLKMQYACIEAKYLHWKSCHISTLTFTFFRLRNLREIWFENNKKEDIKRVNHGPADRALGIPPFLCNPPYNQCPAQWSNSNLYEVVIQAVWPLQHVECVFPSNLRPSHFPKPQPDFRLSLGNLHVYISRSVDGKILVDNDIEDLELAIIPNRPIFRGTLSVSSIDTCVPVEFSRARLYAFMKSIHVLRGLKLACADDSTHGPSIRLHRTQLLLACKSCAYLSKLDLSGYMILQSTIVQCLKAAAKTLRSLRLYRIVLSKGNWAYLFDHLGDQFCLNTLSLELWDFARKLVKFSDKDVQDVMDWMGGRSDFHPLRLMEAHWTES